MERDCAINLYTTDILLRYKSEWDPRAHAHTKGGYLDGEIRVPKVGRSIELMCNHVLHNYDSIATM